MTKVIVVGATGLVGGTILSLLEERNFPADEVKCLASERSAGKTLPFRGKDLVVRPLQSEEFQGYDLALFAAGGAVSRDFIPLALDAGLEVVDNSSYFRMDPSVPLVVPEVNPESIGKARLIANPNCSTIQCMAPLFALDRTLGLKRVVYSTYQSASGSGMKGLEDLKEGTSHAYTHPIRDNLLPQIDDFLESGYTKEEMKMVNESRKILSRPGLPVTATAVRVPVPYCHGVSINVELQRDFDLEEVRDLLGSQEGLIVLDRPGEGIYPMPKDLVGTDEVYVGRIRRDSSVPYGLHLWTVADNVRKGAALNTVEIAELLLQRK